jgi:ribosomal protein S28E/S33
MKNTKAQVLEVVGKQGFWKSEVTGELNQIFVKCLDDRLNCEEYTNCDAVKRREE